MEIFDEIIRAYPLTERLTPDAALFRVMKKRFVLLWQEPIAKEGIEATLDRVKATLDKGSALGWRTVVVVASTKESFESEELFFFDGVNTFVVFYLIDPEKKCVYKNDSWIFALGQNYKKVVRRIHAILKPFFPEA